MLKRRLPSNERFVDFGGYAFDYAPTHDGFYQPSVSLLGELLRHEREGHVMGIFDGLFRMVPVDETGAPIEPEAPAQENEQVPTQEPETPAQENEQVPTQEPEVPAQSEIEALQAEVAALKRQLASVVTYGAATKAKEPEPITNPAPIEGVADLDFSRDGKF